MPGDKQEVLAAGKYLQLIKQGTWEFAARTRGIRAVAIVATTPSNELILTEQFRVPIGKFVIDLPAGLVGDDPGCEGEAEELAACRELEEETGYRARRLKKLVSGPTTSGLASELVTFFRAKNVRRVSDGGGVESESIQVHVIAVQKVLAWLKRAEKKGKLIDVKTYFAAAWLAASVPPNSK